MELARKYGASDKTIYEWRKRFDGLTAGGLARLKHLGQENRKLKQLVAENSVDKQMLLEIFREEL